MDRDRKEHSTPRVYHNGIAGIVLPVAGYELGAGTAVLRGHCTLRG